MLSNKGFRRRRIFPLSQFPSNVPYTNFRLKSHIPFHITYPVPYPISNIPFNIPNPVPNPSLIPRPKCKTISGEISLPILRIWIISVGRYPANDGYSPNYGYPLYYRNQDIVLHQNENSTNMANFRKIGRITFCLCFFRVVHRKLNFKMFK